MTEISSNLKATLAYQIAEKLDAQDGNKDGTINASIWNEFVKDKGGKTIKNSISLKNAMNSITTYVVRMAAQSGNKINELAKTWLDSIPNETQASDTTNAETKPTENATESTNQNQNTDNTNNKANDLASIKVTVPLDKTYISQYNKSQKEADSIVRNSLMNRHNPTRVENELKNINKDNVAYVLNKDPNLPTITNINNIVKYFAKPLLKKIKELDGEDEQQKTNIKNKLEQICKTPSNHKKDMLNIFKEARNFIIHANNKKIEDYNNHKKASKVFEEANKLLVDVAYMDPKPEIKSGKYSKYTILPDERVITVYYDENGEINEILLDTNTHDNTRFEVSYTKDEAGCNTDYSNNKYEVNISSGYNFEKLKEIAERIFGKIEKS